MSDVLSQPALRRLGLCLSIGLLMAVMTGPQGRENDHWYAITQALKPGHLIPWLVLGVVLWAVVTVWLHYRTTGQDGLQPVRDATSAAWTRQPVRIFVYA